MSKECPFCFETYTDCKRFKISCANCQKECCCDCFKNFFLKGEELQLKCPFDCNHVYDLAQLHKINGNNMSFFKKLLTRLTETNLIYEESLLAETQVAAKNEKDWRSFKEYKKQEQAEIDKLHALIKAKKEHLWNIENNIIHRMYNKEDTSKNEYTFIKECSHEDCRGKLNTQWKCILCENYTCSRCHTAKNGRDDPDHVCDEDVVKNLEALRKESRPCPKCGTGISKIDGCDQMFCVSCHTAFSWRTGKIEEGYIHNPEYFRYRREHNLDIARNPGELPVEINECFDPFENGQNRRYVDTIIRTSDILTGNERLRILELLRFATHLVIVDIPRYNYDIDKKTKDLRIKYLLGDITKEKWHFRLKKIIKEKYFNKEIKDLIITLKDIIKDIIINIVVRLSDLESYETLHQFITDQMKHFVYWFNKQNNDLFNCASAYGSKKILHYESRYNRFINSDEPLLQIYYY